MLSFSTLFSSEGSQVRIQAAREVPGAFSVNWFIQLRWVAVLGQILTVLGASLLFEISLRVQPLVVTIVITAVSNLALTGWYFSRRHADPLPHLDVTWSAILGVVMGADLLLLTALLYYSGGPSNPFWIFYFVNLCLAGIELAAASAWCLNFLAIFCFAFLLYDHQPLDVEVLRDFLPSIRLHKTITLAHNGMFCAFVTCATVVVFFTTLVTSKLRQREAQLRHSEASRARGEKLEALGTLAAGAAHELATPLGTIAVVAHELGRELDSITDNEHIHEDVNLIRSELNRCRQILNQMSAQAGEASIEKHETISAEQLMELILAEVSQPERVRVSLEPAIAALLVSVQPIQVAQALRGMVKNALEATSPEMEVRCELSLSDEQARRFLELKIVDQGEGIPQDVLNRIGEPFFTTKETGKGMGLGVFLARSVLERLGGRFKIDSRRGVGTVVTCLIPVDDRKNRLK